MAPDLAIHERCMLKLLQRLQVGRFHPKLETCSSEVPKEEYLGMVVSNEGIEANQANFKPMHDEPELSGRSERGSLASQSAPRSTKTREHQTALEAIKEILCGPLLVCHHDLRGTLVVAADASQSAIGGVLLQRYA